MPPPERPSIKSNRSASSVHKCSPSRLEGTCQDTTHPSSRPGFNRATTSTGFEGPTTACVMLRLQRAPEAIEEYLARVLPSAPSVNNCGPIRPAHRTLTVLTNLPTNQTFYSSPDKPYKERSASPATSAWQCAAFTGLQATQNFLTGKKPPPPPPPPSRAKKPPPPPPPMKRSALSTATMSLTRDACQSCLLARGGDIGV